MLLELPLNQLSRGMPRPKAADFGLGHQFVVLLLEVALDIVLGDGDDDMPLAGAGLIDFHFQRQAGLFLFLFALAFGRGFFIDFSGAHIP
jgi:hypothetical protein